MKTFEKGMFSILFLVAIGCGGNEITVADDPIVETDPDPEPETAFDMIDSFPADGQVDLDPNTVELWVEMTEEIDEASVKDNVVLVSLASNPEIIVHTRYASGFKVMFLIQVPSKLRDLSDYQISVLPGLTSKSGKVLGKPLTIQFSTADDPAPFVVEMDKVIDLFQPNTTECKVKITFSEPLAQNPIVEYTKSGQQFSATITKLNDSLYSALPDQEMCMSPSFSAIVEVSNIKDARNQIGPVYQESFTFTFGTFLPL